MTKPPKFCTACGAPLDAGMKFCSQCGQPVAVPGTAGPRVTASPPDRPPATPPAALPGGGERILGIIPFIEQGLLSVIHYTLIVTAHRLIFCTWDPDSDAAMSDENDALMQESCSISEIRDEIAHFRAKDWSAGPWQRYLSMTPDAISAGPPGTVTIPLGEITGASIICETLTSTQDTLRIRQKNRELVFDLMYSQGLYLSGILAPLLGERLVTEGHLHRRRGIDRLLSGQEYK